MKIELSHQQRRALLGFDAGDITIQPTTEGTYRGAIIVEHETAQGLHLISETGAIERIDATDDLLPLIEIGPLVVDRRARKAYVDGNPLTLSELQFDLLAYLAKDPHRVFRKHQLMYHVWHWSPADANPNTRRLDAAACRTRHVLADAGLPGWLVSIRNVGYRLQP